MARPESHGAKQRADRLARADHVQHSGSAAIGDDRQAQLRSLAIAHRGELAFHAAASAAVSALRVAANQSRSRPSIPESVPPRRFASRSLADRSCINRPRRTAGSAGRRRCASSPARKVCRCRRKRARVPPLPAGRSSSAVETVSFSLMIGMTPKPQQRAERRAQILVPLADRRNRLRSAAPAPREAPASRTRRRTCSSTGSGPPPRTPAPSPLRRAAPSSASRCAPRPTAPEDTSSTSRPARRKFASDSAMPYSTPIETEPSSRIRTLVPTFTTMRDAAATASREVPSNCCMLRVSITCLLRNPQYSASRRTIPQGSRPRAMPTGHVMAKSELFLEVCRFRDG